MARYHSVLLAGFFITALAGCSSPQATTNTTPQVTEAAAPAKNDVDQVKVNPKDFEAWLNVMPGSPPSLHVEGRTGAVVAPSAGWTAELVDGPPGKAARTKVLELHATAPQAGASVVTPIDVPPYVEDPAPANYSRVTIWHGKEHFTIRVNRAQ